MGCAAEHDSVRELFIISPETQQYYHNPRKLLIIIPETLNIPVLNHPETFSLSMFAAKIYRWSIHAMLHHNGDRAVQVSKSPLQVPPLAAAQTSKGWVRQKANNTFRNDSNLKHSRTYVPSLSSTRSKWVKVPK